MKYIHKYTTWILLIICFVGIFLRLLGFGMIPSSLNRDEAALGYNAYSLLKTGMDEWGVSWPIVFRSFGDYKLAGYIYSLIPFVSIFGLNQWVVRVPSLIAGILLILISYFLVLQITKDKVFGLLTAFFISLTPWAIHYSHVGFEANLALFFFVFSLTLAGDKRGICIVLSTVAMMLSLLTYNAPLVLLPGIVGLLFFAQKRIYLQPLLFVGIGILVFALVFPATKGKGNITIFSNQQLMEQSRQARANSETYSIQRVLSNPLFFVIPTLTRNYFSSYDPQFLVKGGGSNPWHQPPGWGHMSWSLVLLFAIGITFAWKIYPQHKQRVLLYGSLLISPLASAITIDAPQATRMLFFLYMFVIFAAIGMRWLITYNKTFAFLMTCILLIEVSLYMRLYLCEFSTHPQIEWGVGTQRALLEVEKQRSQDMNVVVYGDTHYAYIYPLFYLAVNPDIFRSSVQYYPLDNLGLSQVKSFGHFRFSAQIDAQNKEKYTVKILEDVRE
ncbi:MAG: glycosyltransferase family 39 protein [Candidatus Pacebacteria bacterium]|nr:glycosyltransferase family 39 protein [Candidatus Paceibacterota bacterium]